MKTTFARHDFDRMICVAERELLRRRRFYPRAVEAEKMTEVNANYEIAIQQAILDFLTGCRGALSMQTIEDPGDQKQADQVRNVG